MFSLVSSTSSSQALPTRRIASSTTETSAATPRASSGVATQRPDLSDAAIMELILGAPLATSTPAARAPHIDLVANRPPAFAKRGKRVVLPTNRRSCGLEGSLSSDAAHCTQPFPCTLGSIASPTLDVRRRENEAAEAKKLSVMREETIQRYGNCSDMNLGSAAATLDLPRNCTMFPVNSAVVHAPRHPSGHSGATSSSTPRRLPTRFPPHAPHDYATVEESESSVSASTGGGGGGQVGGASAGVHAARRRHGDLPQTFRDIILWERLRRLDALTKPRLFDGSLSLVEELLLSFEALIEHGFCLRGGSLPSATVERGSESDVARQLAQRLFAVVKAAVVVPPSAASPSASPPSDVVALVDATTSPSPSTAAHVWDYLESESWYATVQGKDFAAVHPTAKSFKAALQNCVDQLRVLETTVAHRDAQLNAAHEMIGKYQRAFRTVTAGGEEVVVQRPGGSQKRRLISGGGATRGTSPLTDTDGDTESPAAADGGRRGTARPDDATADTAVAATATLSVGELEPPPRLTTIPSTSATQLKPVVQAATEQVVAELLEQNAQLIHKVAEQSARIETFRVHVVYLERQVEEMNHAVAVLVNSNFELAQQYKAAIGVGSSSGNAASSGGGPGMQCGTTALTTTTTTAPLYSPMLLDGRTAELVTYQSNLEIAKLLGVPLHTLLSQQQQQTAATASAYAPTSNLTTLGHSQQPRNSRTGSQTGLSALRSPPDSRKPSLVANTASNSRRSTYLDEGFASTA